MTVIESLEIKNFQRVSAVKIEPTNSLILLMGQNKQGKTSVLDAIQTSLAGFNGRVTKRPIKDGAGRADILIGLSDGSKTHRKFTPSGTAVVGTRADGQKFGQKDLDAILSPLGPDASAFINAGERKQLETLLSIVDLPFVPAELDAQVKQVEDARRLIGQQGKAIGEVTVDETLPIEEPSATDLLGKIQAGQAHNQARDHVEVAGANAKIMVDSKRAHIEELKTQLAEAEAHLPVLVDEAEVLRKKFLDLAPPVDLDALGQQLAVVEVDAGNIRANNAARVQAQRKELLRAEYEAHTAKLEAIKQQKADGLAHAQMPIEGLSFDEEGVLYNTKPFTSASGSEKIIVSAAMIIATNPELRTMVIRDGNVMDQNSLRILQDMLEDNNFQAFVEFVSESDDGEYVIVDGELA